MHVVLIVVGILLLVFGGGCTVFAFYAAANHPWTDPEPALQAIGRALIGGWLLGSLIPLVIGGLMIGAGLKRAKPLAELNPPDKGDDP
jgi:hypothetical protein